MTRFADICVLNHPNRSRVCSEAHGEPSAVRRASHLGSVTVISQRSAALGCALVLSACTHTSAPRVAATPLAPASPASQGIYVLAAAGGEEAVYRIAADGVPHV